jgi:hypothetical protein
MDSTDSCGPNQRRRRRRAVRHSTVDQITHLPIDTLKPSPENSVLYRQRTPDDADLKGLIDSVRARGILDPLVISEDRFVISGHNRLQAATVVGLELIPCRIVPIRRDDHTADEWVVLLRQHNAGRLKSFDEVMRESACDVDPEQALRAARDARRRAVLGGAPEVEIRGHHAGRSEITRLKQPMLTAILRILTELKESDDLPISVRGVHYALLRDPPLRNADRRDSTYRNDRKSYSDCSDLIARARLAGVISWQAITDETRETVCWKTFPHAGEFLRDQTSRYLDGYCRDLQQSQEMFFAVVAEKLTVKGFLEQTCAGYCIPLLISRGNCSVSVRFELVERFKRSGKQAMHLFLLSDCDPDGDVISESFCKSVRDEFEIDRFSADRVAISHQQADELGLPRNLVAKETSSKTAGWVKRNGRSDCYELEAVSPQQLRRWLDEAIRARIDIEAYNHEVEQQDSEAVELARQKRAAIRLIQARDAE